MSLILNYVHKSMTVAFAAKMGLYAHFLGVDRTVLFSNDTPAVSLETTHAE
jgi:hypothetical protein